MAVVLKCPVCREKFRYDISEGWPDFCPCCGEDINNRRADDDVVMPNILSFKTKANDKVARDIMDGSERRAEIAAQLSGTTVEEMSSLKITNLNDDKGSLYSAKEVNNSVTQQMELIKARGGQVGFGATQGAEFAANAHAPVDMGGGVLKQVEPYAGARAMRKLQNAMNPIGQAPLPREITDNPNYRSRV